MEALAALLVSREDEHGRRLRHALFGGLDAHEAAHHLTACVEEALGPVDSPLFVNSGVGLVVGVQLVDGRRVVLKVHRWQVTVRRLTAVQDVQRVLADEGLPAPRPLHPPTALGRGIATIEEMLPGREADGHDPAVRRAVAGALADFIRSASGIDPRPPVGDGVLTREPRGRLWGEPHDLRFDFDATRAGAEWIDELARRARGELAEAELDHVVAHLDWRVQNLAFDGHLVVAIHDWDSVGVAPEPVAVGQAAAQFSTDWTVGWETLPNVAEMRAFVHDYEAARGRPFTADERHALDAANLLLCAYGARCEHSDRVLHPELASPAGGGWGLLLEARGIDALW